MRKLSVLLIAVVGLSLSAFAQDKVEVFGGYSLLRLDANAAPTDQRNLNGWDAELGGKVLPFVSIVGDVSGHYQTIDLGSVGNVKNSVYTFMGGPRVSVKVGGIRPFAHVLFGLEHDKSEANALVLPAGLGSLGTFTDSNNNFAMAVGGGVDISVAPFLAIRPVKLDYLFVRNDVFDINGLSVATHTNNLRYSAGIVLHF
jgi:hypothetical protein